MVDLCSLTTNTYTFPKMTLVKIKIISLILVKMIYVIFYLLYFSFTF